MISHYASIAIAVLALSGRAETLVAMPPAESDGKRHVDGVGVVTADADKAAVPSAMDPAPREGNPLWAIPLKQLPFTRDKPIFSPSRRPPPPPVVNAPIVPRVEPVAAKPPERPGLTLIGTIVGGTEQIGIFIEQATKQIIKLKAGEDYNGWLLQFVKGREVALQKSLETVSMELPAPTVVAGPPPNSPAVAAPGSPMTPANAAPAIAASPPASAIVANSPEPPPDPPPAVQNPFASLLQFRQTLAPARTPTSGPPSPAAARTPTGDPPSGIDVLRNLVGVR